MFAPVPNWLYLILTVPTISAFIGWVTNWQAVKMIFWPERFVGVGKLGWQGIIYHHADKFAANLGRIARDDLMSGPEMVQRIDPADLEKTLAPVVDTETPRLIADVAELVKPGAWATVPAPMQAMVVEQVKVKTRALSREVVTELQAETASMLDVQELVQGQLSGPNVRRLARLTKQIGNKEFKFIEWSGAVFGAIIGFGQLAVWSTMQTWWLMPIFGIVVGLVTNWLAIQMIFRPFEPRRYLGVWRYQGLFPKRQPEIARDYGITTGGEVITPKNIIDLMTRGERGTALAARIRATLSAKLDVEWQQLQPMVPVPITPEQREQIKALIIDRLFELAPRTRPEIEAYLQTKLDIANTVEARLGALSKPEFERLLRGVFQEDELTLIVVGGVLGGMVGALQAAVVLAG
jgi:uncharacterized membrane protein YheB (UPF0754 family)